MANTPLSRAEDILQATIDGEPYNEPPQSRVENLLIELKKVIEEGGGGTGDYNNLSNQPQIEGVTLSGNKTASDLGLAALDNTGKIPSSQLPSYVDDVIEGYYDSVSGKFYEDPQGMIEIPGERGKIYVDVGTDKAYRWTGTVFFCINEGGMVTDSQWSSITELLA